MSSVPHVSTKTFQVWIAGHGAHRAQAKDLFERLAAGIADKSGRSAGWASIRDIVNGRRAASQMTGQMTGQGRIGETAAEATSTQDEAS